MIGEYVMFLGKETNKRKKIQNEVDLEDKGNKTTEVRHSIFQPFFMVKHNKITICARGCKCYKRRTDVPDECFEVFSGLITSRMFEIVGLGKIRRVPQVLFFILSIDTFLLSFFNSAN
jgi:hypothetical protein